MLGALREPSLIVEATDMAELAEEAQERLTMPRVSEDETRTWFG